VPGREPAARAGGREAPATSTPEPGLPSSSWPAFSACLAITLAIFVGLNPVWEPLDMDAMDANIGWSYAPIPLLVAAALARERKLRWSSFAIESVKLTLVKFALTFLAANVVWAVTAPPGPAAPPPRPARPPASASGVLHAPRAAPPPSAVEDGTTGDLAVRVADASGRPLPGTPVWIAGGLKRLVHAPPREAAVLADDGHGFGPALTVVQTWQHVVLRSDDGALHTAHAAGVGGRQLFNYRVLPAAPSDLMFDRPLGLVTLTCKVHGHDERTARLLVVAHPFAALADDDGRVLFTYVPAGELEVAAWTPERGSWRGAVVVQRGARATLELGAP
jgi:hypothetical protein